MPDTNERGLYRPFLEGERISLREVRSSDVTDEYYQWLNDPEVSQFLETRFYPQSRESIERYVANMAATRDSVFLAIIEKESGKHIGNIKIGPINWLHRFADVALVLGDKTTWGKGFGSEAIRVVTRYAFTTLNLHRLQAHVDSANVGSHKAFLKAGYHEEATFRSKRFRNGCYTDELLLAIVHME